MVFWKLSDTVAGLKFKSVTVICAVPWFIAWAPIPEELTAVLHVRDIGRFVFGAKNCT